MKLATPFQLHCDYEDVIDEWNINYDPYKYTKTDKLNQTANKKEESQMLFDKLITFVEQYPNKRINIAITDNNIPVSHLVTLNKLHDNVYVKLNIYQQRYATEFKNKGIKFFFNSTWA